MNCRRARQYMMLYLYEELEQEKVDPLLEHLNACSGCSREFAATGMIFEKLNAGYEVNQTPDWERGWRRIQTRMNESGPSRQYTWLPVLRWSGAAAAALVLLVVGVFIGRSGKAVDFATDTHNGSMLTAAAQNYLNDVKPLLLDVVNTGWRQEDGGIGETEQNMVASLLLQTRLLQRRTRDNGDQQLALLLEDLELVLMDLCQYFSRERSPIGETRAFIEEKGIPLQIDLWQKKSQRNQTI